MKRSSGGNSENECAFIAGGNTGLVIASVSTVEHTCQIKDTLSPHKTRVNAVTWNHNNKVIISASEDGSISMVVEEGLKTLGNISAQKDVKTLAITNGSKFLCTAGSDGSVSVWDLKKSVVVRDFKDHTDCVNCLVFNEGDRYLATASSSGDIIIYNFESYQLSARMRPNQTQGILSLNYSMHKPHLLASAGEDGSVHVWDTTRSKILCSFHEHNAPCISAQWTSLNEVLLISAGLDKKIFLYDIEERRQVKEIKTSYPISSFAVHEDGALLVAGTTTGTLFIYSLHKLNQVFEISVFPFTPVNCIAFKKPKRTSKRLSGSKLTKPLKDILAEEMMSSKIMSQSRNSPSFSTPPHSTFQSKDTGMSVFSPIQGSAHILNTPPVVHAFPSVDALRMQVQQEIIPITKKPLLSSSSGSATSIPSFTSHSLFNSESQSGSSTSNSNFQINSVNNQNQMEDDLPSQITQSGPSTFSPVESISPQQQQQQQPVHQQHQQSVQQQPQYQPHQSFQHSNTRSESSLSENSQSFQAMFVKNAIEDVMNSYRYSIHEDIRNLHLDMLRQFHINTEQTNELILNLTQQVKDLSEQVQSLKEENKQLKFLHSLED